MVTFGLLYSLVFVFSLNRSILVRYRADIYQRWYASRQWLQTGRSVYDLQNDVEVAADFRSGQPTVTWAGYHYPGPLLLITVPLALLPYRLAHFIWLLATVWFLWITVIVTVRAVEWDASPRALLGVLVFATLTIPSLTHAVWAQFNTISMMFFSLAHLALKRGRFAKAGTLLAAQIIKPQVSILLVGAVLGWALVKRARWRIVLGFGLGVASLWLAAEIIEQRWVLQFVRRAQDYPLPLTSILDKYFNPFQIPAILTGVFVAYILWRQRNSEYHQRHIDLALALAASAHFLIFPSGGIINPINLTYPMVIILAVAQADRWAFRRQLTWALVGLHSVAWIALIGITVGGFATRGRGLNITVPMFFHYDLMSLGLVLVALYALEAIPGSRPMPANSASKKGCY